MNASQKIDQYLASQEGWKQKNLELFRSLVHEIEPGVVEDWKWSVPVFLTNGKLVCAMSSFKEHTKYNFFYGADISDKHRLFNNGLQSKQHRSIDLLKGQILDLAKLRDLIQEAFNHIK